MRPFAYFPPVAGINWPAVMANPDVALAITNQPLIAMRLCLAGQPAIAVIGMPKGAIKKWLRDRGANVIDKTGMN
ncbi:MAG: hypothetical protein KGJ49_04360 [Alphaproteobacteria bacterium]|nr:hypothetical protein [Alphaproteobacteria bacterium]